jgi:hypothetical protein
MFSRYAQWNITIAMMMMADRSGGRVVTPKRGTPILYRAPAAFRFSQYCFVIGQMGRIPSILGSGAIRRAPRRDSSRLKGFIEDVASGIKQSVQLGDFLHPIQFFSQRFDGPSSLPRQGMRATWQAKDEKAQRVFAVNNSE